MPPHCISSQIPTFHSLFWRCVWTPQVHRSHSILVVQWPSLWPFPLPDRPCSAFQELFPVVVPIRFLFWSPPVSVPSSSLVQVIQRFQELFSQMKYKEAAELAADSPQGVLRTPDTVAKFQVCHIDSSVLRKG